MNNNPRFRSLLAFALSMHSRWSPRADPGSFTMDDFATVDKIDVHVHINSADPAMIDQASADHFRLLTINVDYPDFPPIAEQLKIAQADAASRPAF
jgi:hypothetical protein